MREALSLAALITLSGLIVYPLSGQPAAAPPSGLHQEIPGDAGPAPDFRPFSEEVPDAGASPLGTLSVQVNVDAFGNNIPNDAANEPSIAVDPNDPDRIVIGWRQFDTINSNFREAGYAWSHDGGQTWSAGTLDNGNFRSDPVLDSDSAGNFYYYSLSNGFFCQVFKSTDGGVSWSAPVQAFGGDKNWMAIDRTGGIGEGNVYCIWQRLGPFSPAQFCRSIDGAASFQDLIEVPGGPIFGTMTVGAEGEVYAIGNGTGGLLVARSLTAKDRNAAPVFEFATNVDLGVPRLGGPPNPGGLLGQAQVVVDHSNGPTRGNVYGLVSATEQGSSDPADIMIIRSEDGGTTWSAPVRINDDPVGTNAWQWFGTVAVAPNGRIDVVWNDTRDSGQDNISTLYYSFSEDGGVTWSPNVPLSAPFNSHVGWPQQNKLGDYYDMVSTDDAGHLAWAATFNGEQDVYYLRVEPNGVAFAPVEAFSVVFGKFLQGGLEELRFSDRNRLGIEQRAAVTPRLPSIRIAFDSTSPHAEPDALAFRFESLALVDPPARRTISFFNFRDGRWDLIDDRPSSRTGQSHEFVIDDDAGRYVEPGTGRLRARASWFDPGNVVFSRWSAWIDQAVWTVVP